MKFTIFFLFLFLASLLLPGCNEKPKDNPPAEPVSNLVINTVRNDSTGIDSLILRDGDVAMVAKPMDAAARQNGISPDEEKCLKKCKKADGSYDLNCILLCPVSKRYTFTMATERMQ